MAEDLMGYPELMERALKNVVRAALDRIADDGLPGEHHFYITFATLAPGVVISPRLKAQYPDEMSIVLQHQFWGLETDDDGFEVTLSFSGVSERLVIPWDALVGFLDPSVEFGLRFGADLEAALEGEVDEGEVGENDTGEDGATEDEDSEDKDSDDEAGKSGEVVTLDSFRKK
jgi:hypothetical protein